MSQTHAFGRLGQISRSAADIAAAEAWYRDVLGLTHLYTFGPLAFFDCAGTRLMLSAEPGQAVDQTILYFSVPDIAARTAELREKGVEIVDGPKCIHRHANGVEEWMAFFKDNEGRLLALMSQITPGAEAAHG